MIQQGFKLDRFQEEAINYAENNYSVIVSAPTGAGKTLIAERIIEHCLQQNKGVIYTAPIKALSNQKFRDFSKKYPQMVGILTGDVSINRQAPILIMTTEIFRNALLVNPEEFFYREWVIFDEIHYLDDIERGTVWEEAIILLPKHMKMLALSATIPNLADFTQWLRSIHHFPVKAILEKNRPVPLRFFFQCNNEFFLSLSELEKRGFLKTQKKFDPKEMPTKANRMHTLVDYLREKGGFPCLYFSFSRKRCEVLAQEISYMDFLKKEEKNKIVQLFNNLTEKFNLTSNYTAMLLPLIKKGIAYHHAGLLPTLKEIIEQLFTTGLIKVIFTTETFALGINMPAKTVIFDRISKYYQHYHRQLKVRDLYQMAGRAGRRGIDNEGYVIIRLSPFIYDYPSLKGMLYGEYEPINSQFNSCYATILNLYKIMGEKIYDIYPRSFHFYQAKPWEKKKALSLLKRKISLLKQLRYILEDGISWKADLASKVYSFELQIGELFENGFLESLDEKTLFIVILALTYEPRKGERKPKLDKKIKKIKDRLEDFLENIHKEEKGLHIYPLSKRFYFHLTNAGLAWWEGAGFVELNKFCDIDEGEIVRYFRMSLQVFREMVSSHIIKDDFKKKLLNCFKRINRDEVDAEKQLRQEL